MDMQSLRVFVTVAEELHFGRAAARLHLAQPPVSRTIKTLEEDLGTLLFERTTRSVRLTSAGAALHSRAVRLLDEYAAAREDVAAAARGESGRASIAFAGASTHRLVGRLARSVRASLPRVRLDLQSQNFAGPAMARVLAGEVDLAFGRWDRLPSGIEALPVASERLTLAVPASHPFARAQGLRFEDLASEPFVTLPPHPGSVLTERLTRLGHDAGFEPRIVQIAPDTWTALALTGAEVGLHLTVSTVADHIDDSHLAFVPLLDEAEEVLLRLVWRTDSRNEAVPPIIGLARELVRADGPTRAREAAATPSAAS